VARKATIASGLLRLLADKICENNRRRRARARALQGAKGLFKSVFVERSGSILQQQASRVAFVIFFELFLGLFQCITIHKEHNQFMTTATASTLLLLLLLVLIQVAVQLSLTVL
jgi:hypothetical protein